MASYHVVLENSEYVPDIVFADLLQHIFRVPNEQVGHHIIGLKNLGSLRIANLPFQIAEQKLYEVLMISKQYSVDLSCRLEREND